MSAVSAPSREPCPRVSLSTSVLIVMLLSIPMSAGGLRGLAEPMTGVRVGLSPHRALPVGIACRLHDGIRYEIPTGPIPVPAQLNTFHGEPTALFVTPLREALLDLPPPALV
ncbi:MAG: hypothetical protein K8E66_00785 [Phycisphaerales bacterium]|nr:hypothetical protein [Phycisphaerales bacterium]